MTKLTEVLPYDKYEVTKRRPSHFDPRAEIEEVLGMRCPRCEKELPSLGHGQKQVCECGLELQLWGNGLHCTGEVLNWSDHLARTLGR